MFYTRAGDGKISKISAQTEALGALDELNSFLGVIKVKADPENVKILGQVQQDLFVIQAAVAGASKLIVPKKVAVMEKIIDRIERELPAIKTFLLAGGTELSAQFDYARAIARRAERRVLAFSEKQKMSKTTLAYLNRLSSLLYALARLENHKSGINEESPRY